MEPLLLARRSESDDLMESEALTIAEMDEPDFGKEWIASSRHLRLPKASATCFNQGMDKSGHASQLKIRDESLICPMTAIRDMGEEELDLNLVQQPGTTCCR
jgi:hypothetical protein